MNITRDAMWKLIPGLLLYNLIGRHILWRGAQRRWKAEGHNPADLDQWRPGWISLRDMRSIPFRSNVED